MASFNPVLGRISLDELCHLLTSLKERRTTPADASEALGVFVVYGSWNEKKDFNPRSIIERIAPLAKQCAEKSVLGYVQVDESDDALQICLGDNDAQKCMGPCPPSELPALLVVTQHESMDHAVVEFVRGILPFELSKPLQNESVPDTWLPQLRDAVIAVRSQLFSIRNKTPLKDEDTIRIFVSGDRASVGKSSVCLGILGSLVSMGYEPASLAYIKPATQSEAPQPVQLYCEKVGIECVPIGPIVYYKGFTRAFLAGETETSAQLLANATEAVDELARGKRVVMIDGVGFPSVGSICGTDNATVARACGYPGEQEASRVPPGVIVVGGSGVGAAVDAFNLNATYFQAHSIPVMGAIFNKLSLDGFYSLDNCRREVTAYFDQDQRGLRPFGFVPLAPGIASDSPMDHVEDYIQTFREHVDVKGIIEAAARQIPVKGQSPPIKWAESRPKKRTKLPVKRSAMSSSKRTRQDIERQAKQAGAARSA